MFVLPRASRNTGYVLALLCAAAPVNPARAQVVVDAAAAPASAPVASSPSGWMHGGTVRTVFGYTDNVLWSALSPQGRGFAQAGLEAFSFGSRDARWEAKALLSGEVRRYVSPIAETAGEQSWLGRGEVAVFPIPTLRLSLTPQVFYMDQVYDLSADRDRPFVAQMRVRGAVGGVNARLAPGRRWEIEPQAQTRRTEYRDFAEDFGETRIGARVRWRGSDRLEVGTGFFQHRRSYRDRVTYTAGGRALVGTKLRFQQTSAEANLRWSWSRRGAWSVSPSLEYLENRDGASGFFDYDLRRARLDFSWEGARWRVDVETSAGRYDYRVQTVGMGLAPPSRLREDFAATLAVEYALGRAWKTVARHTWERTRTNEVNASYRINTISAGVAWSY